MEALKEIFGNETLNYEQFEAKIAESKLKLADLSGGAYVSREKLDALSAERDTLKTRLDEANGKLEGYDPEWKTKAEQAQVEADNKVAAVKRGYVIQNAVSALKFSSEAAKKAFVADLEAKNLPLEDGQIIGFDDFAKKYREDDPQAFAPEKDDPKVTVPGQGKQMQTSAQSVLDSKYKNNPFYKPKGD